MQRIAWQSYVVHVIVLFNVLMTLIALNVNQLGITNPWLLLVGIPFAVGAGSYAINQLKAIGGPPPGVAITPETSKPA